MGFPIRHLARRGRQSVPPLPPPQPLSVICFMHEGADSYCTNGFHCLEKILVGKLTSFTWHVLLLLKARHRAGGTDWLSHRGCGLLGASPVFCSLGPPAPYHVPNPLPDKGVGEGKKNNSCLHEVGTFHCGEKTEIPKAVIPG